MSLQQMPEPSDDHLVVCVGHGCEYVLGGLASRLRAAGLRCLELNTFECDWRQNLTQVKSFPKRTLLSSQHPYIDRRTWRHFYGFDTDIISLSEAIDLIRPSRTYYIPHDLTCPIKDEEAIALCDVTAALMPNDDYWYLRRFTKVYNVGWIGDVADSSDWSYGEGSGVAFLPSEIGYYARAGVDKFMDAFSPVWGLKPIVKFPMMEGVDEFERAVRGLGLIVVPSDVRAERLIENSAIVVSNGLSSIMMESYKRGRFTICLEDGSQPVDLQKEYFAKNRDISLCRIGDLATLVDENITVARNKMNAAKSGSFDFELVLGLISNA